MLWWQGGGGAEVGTAVQQASSPHKAKVMPAWIRISAGWERGMRKVREGRLGLGFQPTVQGGTSQGATLFRRPGVHRET